MQILIQIACSSGNSLRDAIARDKRFERFGLLVTEQKRMGRSHGWSKVHSHSPDRYGAINIQWEASSKVLLCRVVTRKGGNPARLSATSLGTC